MSLYKQAKDRLARFLLGSEVAPQGLVELNQYFRLYGPINFQGERQEDGSIVAVSQNFRYGSIVTHADSQEELYEKIKDAILTAFEVPASFAEDAAIHRIGEEGYAFA